MLITKRKLLKGIIGTIYEMAPGCKPRNIDKIHQYILDWCDKNVEDFVTEVEYDDMRKYIKDMMMPCEEFTQLNISQKLWEQGVRNYKDQYNEGVSICAVGHDSDGNPVTMSKDKEYGDFIDLYALIGVIAYGIVQEHQSDQDCFFCKHASRYGSLLPSDSDICNKCVLNPFHKCNYVPHPKSLLPINSEEYKNYKD